MTDINTVPDLKKFDTNPSKRAEIDAEMHHILEDAMNQNSRVILIFAQLIL